MINNTLTGAADDGYNNTFHHNYWSEYSGIDSDLDGIGDTPYPITGNAMNEDPYPLVFPLDRAPIYWTDVLTSIISEYGHGLNYSLNVYSYGGIDDFWLNDTEHFSISSFGVLNNNSKLELGYYGLQVWVNDLYGNEISIKFTVIVQDTTPPEWSPEPEDLFLGPKDTLRYDLNCTDYSDILIWWLNDTSIFSIDSMGIMTNTTPLVDGVYPIRIQVNDISGNMLVGEFTIIVDLSPPEWIQEPGQFYFEYGTPIRIDLNATDPRGLGSWWIDDIEHFEIDKNGVITNSSTALYGWFPVQVWVNDTLGNTLTAKFSISTPDTTAPHWVQVPTDQTIEFGQDLLYKINATDLSGIDDFRVNDTYHFTIDWEGNLRSIRFLAVRDYPIIIYVDDIWANLNTITIIIHVVDTTPPSLVTDPPNLVLQYDEVLNYQMEVTDLSELWSINDTERFSILNGVISSGILRNETTLLPGTYIIQVNVTDIYGNTLSFVFEVTVLEMPVTTTTVTSITATPETTSTPTTESKPPDGSLMMIFIISGIGGIIIVVILIILRKRMSSEG